MYSLWNRAMLLMWGWLAWGYKLASMRGRRWEPVVTAPLYAATVKDPLHHDPPTLREVWVSTAVNPERALDVNSRK